MELLMIIVVVIGLIARANKAKQAQEDARRKREAAARAAMLQGEQADSRSAQQTRIPLTPPAPTVQPTIAARKPDPRFFDTEEDDEAAQAQIRARKERERLERERRAQQEQKRRAQQPQMRQRLVLPDDEPEGTAKPGSLTASIASTVSTTMIQPKGRRHTLESSYASGHAHAETSMTGLQNDMDCPTEPANAGKPGAAASYSFGAQRLSFDRDAVVNGILYAEILGKPKALRRRA